MAIKTNFGKNIAFYFPTEFEETGIMKCNNKKQQGYYWINDDELVRVNN